MTAKETDMQISERRKSTDKGVYDPASAGAVADAGEFVKPGQRMKSPVAFIPEALQPIKDLYAAAFSGGVPPRTLGLIHLRASQINGCSYCVASGAMEALNRGEKAERLFAVAAWRDAPFFTGAERAALRLAEAVTRLSDRADPVPDEVWEEARNYYNEKGLSALLIAIAATNVFNRMNVPTRQLAGEQKDWQQ